MKKNYYLLASIAILASGQAIGQSKIKDGSITGTSSLPNVNAVLEMETNKRGLLLPRIALTSTTATSPLSAHVAGMTVYNTATAGDVTPGYYYNDGSKWLRLAAGTSGASKWTNDATNTRVALTNLSDGATARPAGNQVYIKDDGNVAIGTPSSTVVRFEINDSSATNRNGLRVTGVHGSVAGSIRSNYFESSTRPTDANNKAINYGAFFAAIHNGTGSLSENRGITAVATSNSTGVIPIASGAYGSIENKSTGTINFSHSLLGGTTNSGTGTIANANGLSVGIANTSTGTITNGYGVRINSIQATNKWSLYASDATAPSYFAGNIGIGTDAPAASLDVAGSPAVATSLDGIIAPRLTGDELQAKTYTAAQTGAKVYVTAAATTPAGQTINVTKAGEYVYDGSAWQPHRSSIWTDNTLTGGTNLVYTDTVANAIANALAIPKQSAAQPGFTVRKRMLATGTGTNSNNNNGINNALTTEAGNTQDFTGQNISFLTTFAHRGSGTISSSGAGAGSFLAENTSGTMNTIYGGNFGTTNRLTVQNDALGTNTLLTNAATADAGGLIATNIAINNLGAVTTKIANINLSVNNVGASVTYPKIPVFAHIDIANTQQHKHAAVYGIRMGTISGSDSVSGIQIGNVTSLDAAVTAYAIKTGTGLVNFGDKVAIGTPSSTIARFEINDSTSTYRNSLRVIGVHGSVAGSIRSNYFESSTLPTDATNKAVNYGAYMASLHNGTGTLGENRGINGIAVNNSTGTVNISNGVNSSVENKSTGTISFAFSLLGTAINSGTGTIANAAGVNVSVSNTSTGAITNGYGLRITNIQATNKWSIYAADATAPSYFAGNVGIDNTAPFAKLQVSSTSNINNGLVVQGGDFGAGYGAMWVQGAGAAQRLYISAKTGGGTPTTDLTTITNSSIILNKDGGNVGIGTGAVTPAVQLDVNGYVKVASADTDGDATPVAGMIRYNSTTNKFQGYVGGGTPGWVDLH